jgi:hypothetical protein
MNKYNIEVGDTVITDLGDNLTYNTEIVTEVREGDFKLNRTGLWWFDKSMDDWISAGNWKVIKKAKGKIVGYKLLKDTPDCKAGTKFLESILLDNKVYKSEDKPHAYYVAEYMNKPEWFEPIYEPTKPTEVKVQTNAGEVRVTANGFYLPNEKGITPKQFENIAKAVKTPLVNHGSTFYDIKVETFKVGCKTFHVNDIPKLEEAIKQVL